MARGDKVAVGVRYFDARGRADSTKGKFHPDKIASGLEKTAKLSGSVVSVPKSAGGSATYPSGVVHGSGTERQRGTDYKTVRGNVGRGPGGSGLQNRMPAGVTRTNGKTAKRSIVDPK